MQVVLTEHPFNFLEPFKEQGRKIWWYGLPATIGTTEYESWNILIIPDYTTGVDKENWWKLFKERRSNIGEIVDEDDIPVYDKEDDYKDYINWGDAFSDKHIDWFRN